MIHTLYAKLPERETLKIEPPPLSERNKKRKHPLHSWGLSILYEQHKHRTSLILTLIQTQPFQLHIPQRFLESMTCTLLMQVLQMLFSFCTIILAICLVATQSFP